MWYTFWGLLLQAIVKAARDLKTNAPLPPTAPMTGAQLADSARQLQLALPTIIEWLDKNPGAVRAADDLLEALRAGGLSWAATAETAVNATPSVFAKAEDWLPTIIGALEAFQPAPTYQPGPGTYRGR